MTTANKLSLSPQALFNVFVTALEGGINYWSECSEYRPWKEDGKTENLDRFYAIIKDLEDEKQPIYLINAKIIKRGMRRLLEGTCTYGGQEYPNARKLWGRVMSEDYDAGDADNVVQAGLFGDIVYG